MDANYCRGPSALDDDDEDDEEEDDDDSWPTESAPDPPDECPPPIPPRFDRAVPHQGDTEEDPNLTWKRNNLDISMNGEPTILPGDPTKERIQSNKRKFVTSNLKFNFDLFKCFITRHWILLSVALVRHSMIFWPMWHTF